MTWVNPPAMRADTRVAFSDAEGAAQWLAGLPRANVDTMLESLDGALAALNRYALPARERYKILEVLRRAAYDTSTVASSRYEGKPLPLPAGAATTLSMVRGVWRALALGYLHCLYASLAGEEGFTAHGARAAHRLLACLRFERWHGDVARHALNDGFWALAHTALHGAGMLEGEQREVEERLGEEDGQSTVSGQYVLLLMLELARPAALTRAQYVAAARWLSRWRELAELLNQPEPGALCVDVGGEQAFAGVGAAGEALRWLKLDRVLRKLKRRREALLEGASPASLRLGEGLSASACDELLGLLLQRLKQTIEGCSGDGEDGVPITAVVGVEPVFRRLGGRGVLDDLQASSTSFVSHVRHERMAVFGHAEAADSVREEPGERWRLLARHGEAVRVLRPAAAGGSRLSLQTLLSVENETGGTPFLMQVRALCARADGSLWAEATLLSGRAEALLLGIRDRQTGRASRHPALALDTESGQVPRRVVVPTGLVPRAASVALLGLGGDPLPYALGEQAMRADDHEVWSLTPA